MYLEKNKLINFLHFLKIYKKDKNKDKEIYEEILTYYDKKNKILFINNTKLNDLIIKYNKDNLIKNIANLIRNQQIEYPYLSLFINLKTIINIINSIKNISIKINTINNKKINYILDIDNIISNNDNKIINNNIIDINFLKNNLNYCIINYFAENDILNCKKKSQFAKPIELIYSKNNYLENALNYIITNNNEISSLLIKKYIKKNIMFCLDNDILHIITILKYNFNELIKHNDNKFNILNIGIDWGEWIILTYLFSNMLCYSFYFNNLNENTIKIIKKQFNNNNIFQTQINFTYIPKEYTTIKFDLVYINLDIFLNYLSSPENTNEIIFNEYIIPIINMIHTKHIVFKINNNFNNLILLFNNIKKKIQHVINININNSLYLIYNNIKK